VLALLLAFSAWLWVQSQETDTARVRLNMAYRLPDELVAVDPLPTNAAVIVQGSRGAIRQAQRHRPTMVVDLADEGVGTHEARLETYAIEGLPSGLELVAFTPDTVPVRLDERARRNVAVRGRWMGEPAPAHEVRGVRVTPAVVEITGPREVVEQLDRIDTLPIDISGWTEGRTVPAELDLPRNLATTSPFEGEAEVEIVSLTSSRQLAQVPVVVPDPAWRPASGSETIAVKLSGPTDVLRSLRADQVLARVELPPGAKGSRYTVAYGSERPPRFEILLPRAEVRVESAPATVEVERR
jgi:YbbR domain-containing protein